MCILLWAYKQHPEFPLILAANRDEFFNRPTASMAFWEDSPYILAGRDLQGGGTWMGITLDGRFAALTNVRDIARIRPEAPSRGLLVSDYLNGDTGPAHYLKEIQSVAKKFNPFNLLVGSMDSLHCLTGVDGQARRLNDGVFGLSNWGLDTPWPKVKKGKAVLTQIIEQAASRDQVDREALFAMLADSDPAPDNLLPDTGVGMEWERVLGSIFVKSPGYGTRCSTVLTFSSEGEVVVEERSFGTEGEADPQSVARHSFAMEQK
ncbi:MAG: NRDE family protein [Desulfatibacillum sp.]|nr:NRDE family protein [Desulfatibacillum sp.]